MYIAPRPRMEDDPLFPVRIGALAVICLCAIQVFRPAMSTLMVASPVFLLTAQRGAFNPAVIFSGAMAFGVLTTILVPVFNYTHDMPAVHLIVTFGIYFAGIHFTRQTGSPIGMICIMPALVSAILAVKSGQTLYLMRDCILQTCVVIVVAVPVLYLLIPTRTAKMMPSEAILAEDSDVSGSLLRAAILLLLTFTLFTRLPLSDMALSITGVFAMMFPDHGDMYLRVRDRIIATFFGAGLAVCIALIVDWNGHYIVLIGLVFLACVLIGQRMFDGWFHSAMYQYVIIVMLIVLQTTFSTSDWNRAATLRVAVTLLGGGCGAIFVAAIETWMRQRRHLRQV